MSWTNTTRKSPVGQIHMPLGTSCRDRLTAAVAQFVSARRSAAHLSSTSVNLAMQLKNAFICRGGHTGQTRDESAASASLSTTRFISFCVSGQLQPSSQTAAQYIHAVAPQQTQQQQRGAGAGIAMAPTLQRRQKVAATAAAAKQHLLAGGRTSSKHWPSLRSRLVFTLNGGAPFPIAQCSAAASGSDPKF